MSNQAIIIDAPTGRHITGTLIKVCGHGIVIDDKRGVRYFATNQRIVQLGDIAADANKQPPEQGRLF